MGKYIILAIIVIGIIIILMISSVNYNKKLKLSFNNLFGKPPKMLDYDLESIESYHKYKKLHTTQGCCIDDITWDDIDMNQVFKRINVCLTSVGEEYLYEVLHEPQFNEDKLLKREKLISYLKENPEDRLALQVYLSKLGKSDYNDISSFIYHADTKSIKYPFLYSILALIPILSMVVLFINRPIGIGCLILSVIINGIVYYKTKVNIVMELSAIQYFSSMLWLCNKICKMKSLESLEVLKELRHSFNVFKHLRGKISGIMKKGVSELDVLAEYIKIVLLYDIRNYNKMIFRINNYTDDFHMIYKSIGEIDLAISVLSFRESLSFYSIPQFHDQSVIQFQELYHPLLKDPISNSGEIKNDSIITGSNASGKSTFIKALAVNGILAQTIYTCMAKEFRIRFSLVITSMAVRDNITLGDSYFITEIKSLKRILDKIQEVNCTCFIDEILRGTNTIERIAASASVLKYLHNANCLTMVASHDIELTDILADKYDNYHFCEQVTDNGIYFDYKLKQGVSNTKNAIKLLKFMDFDREIIENAEKLYAQFITTKTW